MRYITMTALLCLALIATEGTAQANGHPRVDRCRNIDWRKNATQTARLNLCVARNFDVPGGPSHFNAVAVCESGLRWWLRNPPYVGEFQHLADQWPGRWMRWGRPVGVKERPFNALSAAVVTARMVRVVGWSPWACA